MNNIEYWLWLSSIDNVGPIKAQRLLEHFGTPESVWEANEMQLIQIEGVGKNTSKIIESYKDKQKLSKELNKLKEYNIEPINIYSSNYPSNLKNIYDPPVLLFLKGSLKPQDKNSVAIVGSRNSTHYGQKVAYNIAKQLAQNDITVISGMARGIDTAAHKGALDAGGRTIAVLGCGLDIIYPYENKNLMNKIINNGSVITEYFLGTPPNSKNFPRRNRIISGMTLGTVVVEASKRSGSLITADLALEQNKEVFSVPGPIYSKSSQGTNNLIKEGAKLVTSVEDILEELDIKVNQDIKVEKDEQIQYNNLDKNEVIIYNTISDTPIHLEELMKHSGFLIDKLNTIITTLELKGLITQLPGKFFVKK